MYSRIVIKDEYHQSDITMNVHQIWLPPPENPNLPAPHPPRRYTMENLAGGNYKLWGEKDANELVSKLGGKFEELYNSLPHHICKCDVLRYFIMYVFGGAYFDCDFACIRNLKHTFHDTQCVYLCEEWQNSINTGTVHNGAFVSSSRHPFWLAVLDEIILRKANLSKDDIKDKNKSVFQLTGTALLRDVAVKHPKTVKILPFYIFCPYLSSKELVPAWHDSSNFPQPWKFELETTSHHNLLKKYPLSFTVPLSSEKTWQLYFD